MTKLLKSKRISDRLKVKILMDIATGMSFLHKNRIYHRDLKPDNVLVRFPYILLFFSLYFCESNLYFSDSCVKDSKNLTSKFLSEISRKILILVTENKKGSFSSRKRQCNGQNHRVSHLQRSEISYRNLYDIAQF